MNYFTDALNYFSGDYLFKESAYTSGETLVKELSQYSQCKSLIEEAQTVIQKLRFAPLEVRFEPTSPPGFNAQQVKNVIRLRPGLSAAAQRSCFVFELTNLIQHEKHIETWESAQKGVYKNEEEYARAVELIEFHGNKRRNIITKAINKERGRFRRSYFKDSWENYPLDSMEFNRYYSLYLSEDHKEYYRNHWRKLYKIEIPPTTNNIKNPPTNIFNNTLQTALVVSVIVLAFLKFG